jgi:hypothetical protein
MIVLEKKGTPGTQGFVQGPPACSQILQTLEKFYHLLGGIATSKVYTKKG